MSVADSDSSAEFVHVTGRNQKEFEKFRDKLSLKLWYLQYDPGPANSSEVAYLRGAIAAFNWMQDIKWSEAPWSDLQSLGRERTRD